jgi:hypothetical protein
VDFADVERSRDTRHRHRVLVSAYRFVAFFDNPSDRGPTVH